MRQGLFSHKVELILSDIQENLDKTGGTKVLAAELLELILREDPSLSDITHPIKVHHRKKLDVRDLLETAFEESVFEQSEKIDPRHLFLSVIRLVDKKAYSNIKKKLGERGTDKQNSKNAEQKSQPKQPRQPLFADLTYAASLGEFDHLVERSDISNQIITNLLKQDKKGILLSGDAGVGKTSMAQLIAKKIVEGEVPPDLLGTRVVQIEMMRLTHFLTQGQSGGFSDLINSLMKEKARVILFVDNLELINGGLYFGSTPNLGESMPSNTGFNIIGATSNIFKHDFYDSSAFRNTWNTVEIGVPDQKTMGKIMHKILPRLETYHKVSVHKSAIEEVVKLSSNYNSYFDKSMPGALIEYIDEVMAELRSEKSKVGKQSTKMFKMLNTLKRKLFDIKASAGELGADEIRKLENEIHILENNLTSAVSKDRAEKGHKLNKKYLKDHFTKKTGAKIQSASDSGEIDYNKLETNLKANVIGQDKAVSALARALRRSGAGLRETNRPVISAMFLGPTGVGKTHTAKVLAENLFKKTVSVNSSHGNYLRLDMSDFSEKHTVARLIGSPPGYVGYGDGGQLTGFVEENPDSLVLFDEIEKADPQVLNVLLQIMEEGKLVDMTGEEIDFSQTVIIMTSNIGAEIIKAKTIGFSEVDSDEFLYKDMEVKLLDQLKKSLKPELINRMDEIIVFRQLNHADLLKICELELEKIQKALRSKGHKLEVDKSAKEYLVKEGFSEEYGARNLKRTITRNVADPLSEKILSAESKSKRPFKISASRGRMGVR